MGAVHLFNHPVVAALLLTLAFLGLAVEVRSDGFQRAGWAGLLALALFVVSHLLEGTPRWTAIPVAVGLVLLWPALEDPRRRASAALGIGVTAAGAYAVMVGPGPASLDHARAAAVLTASAFLVLASAGLIWSRLPASLRPEHRTAVFFHPPPPASDSPDARTVPAPSVGERGRAVGDLRPVGWILLRGERHEAVAADAWVEEGAEVEVVAADGVRPVVRDVERPAPGA